MSVPAVALDKVSREFLSGESRVSALDNATITIQHGEMVAIVGPSGSGKSTLMNILGCLDRPTSGVYRLSGRDTAALDMNELAELRRQKLGFIFQRYHLLGELTALRNVEMPAIYAGLPLGQRRNRAANLLDRLGMADRLGHTPGQLSGGQQQRVSIARALMNGAEIILADEPTGALDSRNGEEVLRILDELHGEGKTVIIVTHDMAVARRARRIIELSDGAVVSDRPSRPGFPEMRKIAPTRPAATTTPWRAQIGRLREASRMAILAMNAHRLRTFLTMLGIIIGIASVICVVALGTGAQQMVLANINSLGTNTLEIFPGKELGDVRSSKIKTLSIADARVLAQLPYLAAVTPTVSTTATLRSGAVEVSAQINGVGDEYFRVKGTQLAEGTFFDTDSIRAAAQDVVIDDNSRKALLANGSASLLGRIILVGRVPCRVVGVIRQQQGGFGSSANPSVYLPYTTVQARFLGDASLRSIIVRVSDDTATDTAAQTVTQLLIRRHRTKDFSVLNTDDIRRTISSTTQILTLLVAAVAVVSLIVGGIGVMNIMLVSVSERVSEIGVRMAVGARPGDILQQFLIEAVLVCLIGGVLGIGSAFGLGLLFEAFRPGFSMVYTLAPIIIAVLCSILIGVIFGYMPARNASLLDPVAALARE